MSIDNERRKALSYTLKNSIPVLVAALTGTAGTTGTTGTTGTYTDKENNND